MNRNVIVFGAGGHGHVIADIIYASGDRLVGFLDDNPEKETLGPIDDYVRFPDCEFCIGIGNAAFRKKLSALPLKWYTAVHPSAIISPYAEIGEGTVVMPNTTVNYGSRIGKHSIINTGAIVEHNNTIGDYVHISVGVKLGGTVSVGDMTWVGIGTTVNNNLSICGNCMIGAGAVVVRSITCPGTYVGVPAKLIKTN